MGLLKMSGEGGEERRSARNDVRAVGEENLIIQTTTYFQVGI